jgi:S1-C subfamily serine protease
MKLCPKCDQSVAEEITTCPTCGSVIGEGRKYIDDYRIVDVLHEGHSSFLCRAIRERTQELVMIRLFTPESGVDEKVVWRLKRELEELKKLPQEGFVRHHAIRQSSDGLWYRISEWINSENWGSLLAAGKLQDRSVLIDLFYRMASTLAVLHEKGHFIPHLILNDIIVIKESDEDFTIKIDYKLSRFFDPKLNRPGPMLKNLLGCHPDIVNQRPLDYRSDIWSLAKIFVELLTADLETRDFLTKVDELELPAELNVLLKVMLAEDPDMRPRSMAEIAESLAKIKAGEAEKARQATAAAAPAPVRTITRLHKIVNLLAAAVVILIVAGVLAWFQFDRKKDDSSAGFESYANRYAQSVAFLVTEYWIEADGDQYYHNMSEGTAFLVDSNGYLMTGRHVVCPWLEDTNLFATAAQLKAQDITPVFKYRIFLWFEGAKAFNQAARMLSSPEVSDVFFTDIAYSTEAEPRLTIAGVAKPPMQTRQMVTSPLRDDLAVLKIDRVPEGLKPLPIDIGMDPQQIPKLSPIITLGFPLGRRTQADTINVSVTRGNVRRTFENLIQVDTSLHGGNSGGPVIDSRGKVIGIVSGVAMDWSQGFVPMATPVWDLGMVLPITKAVDLLIELKAGQVKWNGVLDFSAEDDLQKIRELAAEGRWADAVKLADEKLAKSLQPALNKAAGMMHFCTADYLEARKLFSQSLSLDAQDYAARFMLYLIDYLTGDVKDSPQRHYLIDLDWRSPAEFQGYLAWVLEGMVAEPTALQGWYNAPEKSWLYYVVSLMHSKREDWQRAEELAQEAVLSAGPDAWEFFLARAQLEQLQKRRRAALKTETQWNKYKTGIEEFEKKVKAGQKAKAELAEQMVALYLKIADNTAGIKDKLQALEDTYEILPDNRSILAALIYYSAAAENWSKSREYIHAFLQTKARQNARRMGIRLFEACILNYEGKDQQAREALEENERRVRDPWFLTISEYLLGKQTDKALKDMAGESPERLITAYTIMGFWDEGAGQGKKAARHYKEAIGSFLDDWLEYDFARQRIQSLKKPAESQNSNHKTGIP